MAETIVITGASRGIGAATARRLAREGRLLLIARTESDLEQVCEDVRDRGGEADLLVGDLSSGEAALEIAEAIRKRAPRLRGLVLNAGMSPEMPFRETSPETLAEVVGVNQLAPMVLLRALLDPLQGGSVVLVGSLTALVPYPGNAAYAATKAALLSFVRSVRPELEEDGVRVGIVLPGYTRTSMTHEASSWLPKADADQVADAIARCLDEGGTVIPGVGNRVLARLYSAFPELGDRVIDLVGDAFVPGGGG